MHGFPHRFGPARRFVVSCLLLGALTAGAGSPWFARVWQVDDGLPGDSVTGVAQTADGFLWVGTQAGLARFDGLKFQRLPMPTGRTHRIIRTLLLDREETLWLAEEGGVVVRYPTRSGPATEITNNIPKSQPLALAQDGAGAVWITYADGSVCRISGNAVERFTETAGLSGAAAGAVAADQSGQVWLVRGGRLGAMRGGVFREQHVFADRTAALTAAHNGGLFVCSGEQIYRWTPGNVPQLLAELPVTAGVVRPTCVLDDARGGLWIGTMSHGLFHFDGMTVERVETSHGRVKTLSRDREGNIWVGTDGGGLNRLRQQVVELRGKDAGLPFDTVRSVAEDKAGKIWAITQNGNLAVLEDKQWRVLTTADGWQGGDATCVAADATGTVYLGTFSRGVHRWRDGEFLPPLRRADGLARAGIRGLLPDRAGNLWIAFSSGDVLQKFGDGKFQDFALPAGSRAVRTLAEDAAGHIWMANLDAQLLRVEGDHVVDMTSVTPEPYRPIRCLAGTPDGSLWIGYSAVGVARLKDGRFHRVSTEEGLPDGSICSLMPDELGNLWFGSDHGIFRVALADLHAAMDKTLPAVRAVGHGRDDGLPSLQCYYGYAPGAARSTDGRILIPTHSGLAIVHPERVAENRVAPPVRIEQLLVDNQPQSLTGTPVSLAPDHHRLEVNFTAPSFIEPERVRFRYRLRGWDEDWVPGGGERTAIYSRLPAGRYEFVVTAANNAGVWNERGAVLPLVVRPFFWQTWWFTLLVAGMFLAITATVFAAARIITQRRLQMKVRRLEQENAVQRERARIAQDIHDDIGAHMTRISLLTDLAERQLDQPALAARHVTQIARISRSAIKALDEIVWAANPRNDTVPDLLDYAGQYAVDFLQLANIRCRVDFPSAIPPRVLSGELRHGLFLAVKEALHNVVKHSHASEVWLRAAVGEHTLTLRLEDNGHGFAAPPDDALADGLRNMRERLAELGGTCAIESQPGAGTRIRFEVTLPRHD